MKKGESKSDNMNCECDDGIHIVDRMSMTLMERSRGMRPPCETKVNSALAEYVQLHKSIARKRQYLKRAFGRGELTGGGSVRLLAATYELRPKPWRDNDIDVRESRCTKTNIQEMCECW